MHYYIQYRARRKGIVGPYKKAVQREIARYSPVSDPLRNKFDLTSPNISFMLSPIYHPLTLPRIHTPKTDPHSLRDVPKITKQFCMNYP